ncbi:hypothetical protein Tco_0963899 [Tanacetum coccineum]
MGNEELSTIPEKESDEFIKSSIEDFVPIPSESEDTSGIHKNLYSDANEILFRPGAELNEIDAFPDMILSTDMRTDHDLKNLKDEPDNLKSMVKVFDPGISEKPFSPTYVRLPFEDRHYLSFTYVIRNFLPYFTYPVVSPILLSSGSEDIIFDPGISAFHFSSLKPVAYECPMEVCSSTCFVPTITIYMESQLETRIRKQGASWLATHSY